MSFALVMLGGLLLDTLIGWPDRLYRRIGHPVTWLGRVISACEARMNSGSGARRRLMGALTVAVVTALAALPAWVVQAALPEGWSGAAIGAVLAWPMIALRAMHDHFAAVARPLLAADLVAARQAVGMIVGRRTRDMDAPAIARAATESLAENASDGIVAPLFWGALLGLPGLYAYKAINTMDSMIGHRSARYEDFGKAAARTDDLVNWLPARLTGLLFATVGARSLHAVRVMARDARKHRSPNAGWPESAMAAALCVRLSGPRIYDGRIAHEPWLNGDAPDPEPRDLLKALALFRRAMLLCALALAALSLL